MSDQMYADESPVDPKLVGIGGWLILPAIGFVLGPIVGLVMLFIGIGLYSEVAKAGYGGLYALELVVEAALLAFLIVVAILFFSKKRIAPAIIIAFIVTNLLVTGGLLVIELGAGAGAFAEESGKQLVRSGIGAAIWIPYFLVSRRVKATFVN